MLTKKQCELLDLLAQSGEVMSSEQISDRLGLSTKTIQRYVELINHELIKYDVGIVSMRGYGFVLQGNIKLAEELMIHLSFHDYDRRMKDIALYLLSREPITIEEMGDLLSYSASTLNKFIPKVKKYLALYDLKLHSKPHYGIYVVGEELNIRNLLIDCAFVKNQYGEITCLIKNIDAEEFQLIRSTVIDFLHQYQIVIADDDVADFMMRITLIASRCKDNRLLDSLEYIEEENLIQTLLQDLAARLKLFIPLSEVSYLSMYFEMISTKLSSNQTVVPEDINAFVMEALGKMQQIYTNLEIKDTVRQSFILHLGLMFNRIHHRHHIKNALLQDIKANYILEMNYAITFGRMVEQQFGITVSEDELGYLALYFALSHSKRKKVRRVIILCNYGIATSQLIKEQICEQFPQLEVVGIYPLYYLEAVVNQDIDLIISTVALDRAKVTKPLIVIRQCLDQDALSEIKRVLDGPQEHGILRYFCSEAFFKLETGSRQDTLDQMADRLVEGGFFDRETVNRIRERERISSTDIGNLIAIPHAIIENDRQSFIGIGILEKPIVWDKEKVQIVLMAGINAQDAEKNKIFRHLYKIIKDVSNVNFLIGAKSFDAFKKLLSE